MRASGDRQQATASEAPAAIISQPPLVLGLALAGAANCCGALATNPLDVLKVRLQLARAPSTPAAIGAPYTEGVARGLAHLLAANGVRGLFAGLAPSLLREGSYSAMRLGLYAPFRDAVSAAAAARAPDTAAGAASPVTPLWVRIAAGAASGCVGCAIASPTDLVKVRLQAATAAGGDGRFGRGIVATVARVVRDEGGVRALWQGADANVQRAALLTAAQVGSYDEIKGRLRRAAASVGGGGAASSGTAGPSGRSWAAPLAVEGTPLHAAAAVAAGLIAAVATTPVDTAKSRLMAQRAAGEGGGAAYRPYRGTADCLLRVAAGEGLRGLYAGFWPTWARLGIHTIVTFTVYERLRVVVGMRPL